ncbi:uncharacterized protein EV420DRAFT_1640240 [Desarmillaria tabescens]|uniref:Uncharacterized protein n=1 Tax=Armillaria tabescens TaxID=1929756 RepID=A0AA39NAA5_ARMTA|nr:uncharacterized protein EV420DRAFT_1640240 [Desarmillaria tabescens]KAK0461941.1 hypothetical protein EV420DRAFT_1640240 [Desarmillaria tabescens]
MLTSHYIPFYKFFPLFTYNVLLPTSETSTQGVAMVLLSRIKRYDIKQALQGFTLTWAHRYDAISSIANSALRTLSIASHRIVPGTVGNTDSTLSNIRLTLTGTAHSAGDRQRGHPKVPLYPTVWRIFDAK